MFLKTAREQYHWPDFSTNEIEPQTVQHQLRLNSAYNYTEKKNAESKIACMTRRADLTSASSCHKIFSYLAEQQVTVGIGLGGKSISGLTQYSGQDMESEEDEIDESEVIKKKLKISVTYSANVQITFKQNSD